MKPNLGKTTIEHQGLMGTSEHFFGWNKLDLDGHFLRKGRPT